jgi:SagB-type dehydrogenase family enzyme
VNRCAPAGAIPVGIYHYDPQGHTLTLVNDEQADVVAVLDMAMVASGTDKRPAALLTATTRQERTSWALGGASYATALMHLGALQQTLYLTAKTLGLAAHAVTVDADDRVEAALRLRWPGEAAIGECVIGPLL